MNLRSRCEEPSVCMELREEQVLVDGNDYPIRNSK